MTAAIRIPDNFADPMPIETRPVAMARFAWSLANLQATADGIPAPFTLRTAGEQEADEAVALVQSCYNLDPEWSGCALHIKGKVLPAVIETLAKEPTCLFVQHGNRIIAASVFDSEPGEDSVHLVSGPCVLIEYRNRGIGGALLGATLGALRDRGVTRALGQTRPNSPSAKYLCSKFGGTAVQAELTEPANRADAA
jgi:hypothetical protein